MSTKQQKLVDELVLKSAKETISRGGVIPPSLIPLVKEALDRLQSEDEE